MKILAITVIALTVTGVFIWLNLRNSTVNRQANFTAPQSSPTLLPSQTVDKNMKLTSPVFENNTNIPVKFTCDGEKINPPLTISDVPVDAKSLVLIVDDPDAPNDDFVHWLVWNILPSTTEISENSKPEGSVEGNTSLDKPGFVAPCPPSGSHRYQFKLYALSDLLNLSESSNKTQLEKAIAGKISNEVQLTGLYKR